MKTNPYRSPQTMPPQKGGQRERFGVHITRAAQATLLGAATFSGVGAAVAVTALLVIFSFALTFRPRLDGIQEQLVEGMFAFALFGGIAGIVCGGLTGLALWTLGRLRLARRRRTFHVAAMFLGSFTLTLFFMAWSTVLPLLFMLIPVAAGGGAIGGRILGRRLQPLVAPHQSK